MGTGARYATRHTVHVPSFSPAPFPPSSRALHRREAVTARLSFNSGLSEGPARMLGSLLPEVCGLPLPFKRNQTLILEYLGSRWTRRSREPLVSADIRVWLEGRGEGRVPQGIRTRLVQGGSTAGPPDFPKRWSQELIKLDVTG